MRNPLVKRERPGITIMRHAVGKPNQSDLTTFMQDVSRDQARASQTRYRGFDLPAPEDFESFILLVGRSAVRSLRCLPATLEMSC
jgi:hypothetical protein